MGAWIDTAAHVLFGSGVSGIVHSTRHVNEIAISVLELTKSVDINDLLEVQSNVTTILVCCCLCKLGVMLPYCFTQGCYQKRRRCVFKEVEKPFQSNTRYANSLLCEVISQTSFVELEDDPDILLVQIEEWEFPC